LQEIEEMPLIHIKKLGFAATLGTWEVTETEIKLQKLYAPNNEEQAILTSFTHSFRRIQFLATRLLFQTLVPDAKIKYDENGKPITDLENINLSISHTGKLIAILINKDCCGIDIESIHPKIERIAHKYLSEVELLECKKDPIVERLHVHWAVKEAMYKIYGFKNISFKTDIFVEVISNTEKGKVKATLIHEGEKISRMVHYERFKDCILAWTEQPS
jgi:4'-phosphopantetheinyl transferase